MAKPTVEQDHETLLSHVPDDGTTVGNIALMRTLGWNEDRYWRRRDELLEQGLLVAGRGRGGSIRKPTQDGSDSELKEEAEQAAPRKRKELEKSYYAPIAKILRTTWSRDMKFTNRVVEITAQQGSRPTGGRWSRPDLVVVSMKVLTYVPGYLFDVWTFEVKPFNSLDVTAVYEALAHARSATRSSVIAPVPAKLSDDVEERLNSIAEEAARHGIGFYTATDVSDYSSWEVRVEPNRNDAAPEHLDNFIRAQLSQETRDEIQKWLRRA